MGGFPRLFAPALLIALAAPVAADAGHAIPWSIDECDFVIALTFIPAALLQPHLPPGWLSPPASQVGFEMEQCRSGTGLAGPVPDMEYATIWAAVIPPTPLRVAGYSSFSINLDSLVPDDDRLTLLRAHGITSVHGGDVAFERTTVEGVGQTMRAVTTYDDEGGFEILAAGDTVRPMTQPGGKFVSYNLGENVLSRWRTDWTTHGMRAYHPAKVTLAPDSTAAEIFGTTEVPAQAWIGTWSYTNGLIEFPLGLR